MSSVGSPIDDEEVLKRIVQQALQEGFAGIDDDFEGLDFGVGASPNEKKPKEALEDYLTDLKREGAQGTHDTHKFRLSFFVDWCRQEDDDGSRRVQYLNELNGQHIKDFRDWRRAESDWEVTTEESQMKTLRQFLRYCEKPEWVPENLSKKVPIPTVDPSDESRDTIIRQHVVDNVLSYLERFEYATMEHCEWLVFGKTGCRISGSVRLTSRTTKLTTKRERRS